MNTKALSFIFALAVLGSLSALYMKSNNQQSTGPLKLSARDVSFIQDLDPSELQYRVSLFNEWAEKHEKRYSLMEAAHRFKAWNKNYEFVQDHNSKNLSWTVEMNLFADLSREEFAALHLGLNAQDYVYDESTVEDLEEDLNDDPNDSVDWRKKGAVTSVKNQGSCGACYAFAAAAGLEGIYKIRKGKLINLSNQQIAACSSSYGNNGCNGGLMTNSYKYTTAKGIQTAKTYPWTGNMGSCKYSSSKVLFKNKGQVTVTRNSYTKLKTAVKKQPVPVGVEADQSGFQLYKSGVLSSNCGANLDHAITIVGYSGTNYWIVKNQWGKSWGLSGYIHIKMGSQNNGAGICGINSMATYPTY